MYTLELNKVYKWLTLEEKGKLLDVMLHYEKHIKKTPLKEFVKYADSAIVNVIFWTIKWAIVKAISDKKKTKDNRTIEWLWEWFSEKDNILFWPRKEWFIRYWWEKNTKGKELWQLQKIFNMKARLERRKKNNYDRIVDYSIMNEFTKWMKEWKIEEMKTQLWVDRFNEIKEEWREISYNCR